MGIKDLWTILAPYCERKPLYELQGKIVAVDLSCWICEAQNVSDYSVQPRMYLRNLYFRTCYLLLMEVIPVFVLEGKAPTLKYQTIADRNAIQFRGAKPKSDKVKTGKDRTRFHFTLKQCEEMLQYMGLTCVTGKGEAEAMCAYLNADGLVSGCISQDSDCFAYGANVVYRNFSISHQGSYAASGGAVDVYDIRKANAVLKFGRNKIITLALLCGSDYNDGVHGVGKDTAMKFMEKYTDEEILDRVRSWRKKDSLYAEMENKIANKNLCTSCGHFGKIQSHTKNGCMDCRTTKGCDFTKYREERLDIKNELNIRSKALADPDFPNETLINEFLIKKDNVKSLCLRWKQPNLINFVKFTNKFLAWEEIYAFEKLLPILTRWQVLNFKFVSDKMKRNSMSEIKGILYPKYIKKVRNPKGVSSYEIIWEDRLKYFEHLIPQAQMDEYLSKNKNNLEVLWSTIEPKHLVDNAYPSLVEEFLEKKNSKAKNPTKRKNAKNKENMNVDQLANQLLNTSISEPKPKKTRKRATKKIQPEENLDTELTVNRLVNISKTKTIDDYFAKTKVNQLKKQHPKLSISFDLDASNFGDEDDLNISDIIDDIVSRKPKLPEKIEKLGYEIVFSENSKTQKYTQSLTDDQKYLSLDLENKQNRILGTNYDYDAKKSHNSVGNYGKYNNLEESSNINRLLETNYDKYDLGESSNQKRSLETNYDKYNLGESSNKNSLLDTDYEKYNFGENENHNFSYGITSDKCENLNQSLFFGTNYEECDLFEKTFDKKLLLDSSGESTDIEPEDFSEKEVNTPGKVSDPDNNKVSDSENKAESESLNDSFDFVYVPLLERIKKNARLNTVP